MIKSLIQRTGLLAGALFVLMPTAMVSQTNPIVNATTVNNTEIDTANTDTDPQSDPFPICTSCTPPSQGN
jgi:hypothetical protein